MTQDPRQAPPPKTPSARNRAGLGGLVALAVVGCATLGGEPGQPLVPDRVVTRTGPFAVYTNLPVDPSATPVRTLQALEREVESGLGLRAGDDGPPVEVYILKDREAFTHFLTFYYPELPPRRAFFLAQGPRRLVYTYYNQRLDEDLRHEATHALLHAAVGDLPLWLDEGLAEYFEGPEGRRGLNPEHLGRLPDDARAGWTPDLARLETLKNVREMTPRNYRESWAWVHYLLNDQPSGRATLLAYLADLRADPQTAAPMSERLAPLDRGGGPALLTHLDRVRNAAPVAAGPANPDPPKVLFQSPAAEPARRGAERRSLFGRFLSLVGGAGRPKGGER